MTWKQIKIFTADAEQSVLIEPNLNQDGILMHCMEEYSKQSFITYMTYNEARTLGAELIKYANEMESESYPTQAKVK